MYKSKFGKIDTYDWFCGPGLHLCIMIHINHINKNVSGYVCNHGSLSGERDTASPRGRYGERRQHDPCLKHTYKNTTCWPATAYDVTTGATTV